VILFVDRSRTAIHLLASLSSSPTPHTSSHHENFGYTRARVCVRVRNTLKSSSFPIESRPPLPLPTLYNYIRTTPNIDINSVYFFFLFFFPFGSHYRLAVALVYQLKNITEISLDIILIVNIFVYIINYQFFPSLSLSFSPSSLGELFFFFFFFFFFVF